MIKRTFDVIFSFCGIVILSPLFFLIALLIKFTSRGNVFFRQERVGKDGKKFKIYKFRTMIDKAWEKGPLITASPYDSRITHIGKFLRKYKLDELPQLINVFKGEMSIVGPRPEIPEYVALYSMEQKRVLSVKPGITDFASLKYINENEILSKTDDWEKAYIEKIMPDKLVLNLEYVKNHTFFMDMLIILKTIKKCLDRPDHFKQYQYFFSVVLFVLLLMVAFSHAKKGIDLTDEGLYLSAPLRYSLGDTPIRDEFMTVLITFDIITSPIFILFPDITLLQVRSLGILLHVLSFLPLFFLLSKTAPPLLVSLSCGAIFLLNNFFGIFSPSYNSLSCDFSLIAFSLWVWAMMTETRKCCFILSAAGGIIFNLATISYSTINIVAILPLLVIIVYFVFLQPGDNRKKVIIQSSIVFLITFIITKVTVILIIILTGLLPDYIQWIKEFTQFHTKVEINTIIQKIITLLKGFWKIIIQKGIILFGTLLVALFIIPKRKSKLNTIIIILAFLFLIIVFYILSPVQKGEIRYPNYLLLSFSVSIAMFCLVFSHLLDSKLNNNLSFRYISNILIIYGFFSAVIYGISSSNGLRNCLLGATTLFVVGMVSFYKILARYTEKIDNGDIRKFVCPLMVFVIPIAFVIEGTIYNNRYFYRETEGDRLIVEFKNRKLSGIYSTPEKVAAIDNLLNYLNGKVKPGEYFLAYNYIPMLYFLTHTRPCYPVVWARDDYPVSLNDILFKRMLDNNKIPEYCIRMLTQPWNNWNIGMSYKKDVPLNNFVESNYYLEKIIYPFEVLHLRPDIKRRLFDKKTPNL